MKKILASIVIFVSLINFIPGEPNAPEAINITDVNNKVYQVSSFTINEKGTCFLLTPTGEIQKPLSDIVEIELPQQKKPDKNQYEFTLNNNDIIRADLKEGLKNGLIIKSPSLGKIQLKFDHLLMIKSLATIPAPKLSPETKEEDMVYLFNGDKDKGTIMGINTETLTIKSSLYDKEKVYPMRDISGITFCQITKPPQEPEGPVGILICQNGSRLTGKIQKLQDKVLYFDSPYGTPYQLAQDMIAHIYFKNARCVYLSDLEPTQVKEYNSVSAQPPGTTPFLWPYQKDKSVVKGEIISLQGKRYYKGLGIHANCELTYKLDSLYKRFFSMIGLDDESGKGGSVKFAVYLDKRKAYESELIKWGDKPKKVDLNVENAQELRLVVTDGGDWLILDRAAWAGARLIK